MEKLKYFPNKNFPKLGHSRFAKSKVVAFINEVILNEITILRLIIEMLIIEMDYGGSSKQIVVDCNRNNDVDNQNNNLKYSYVKNHATTSLTGMLTVVIEEFLPEKYER